VSRSLKFSAKQSQSVNFINLAISGSRSFCETSPRVLTFYKVIIQWNPDLTKRQKTGEIVRLSRVPYIEVLLHTLCYCWAEKYPLLYQGLPYYRGLLNWGSTVKMKWIPNFRCALYSSIFSWPKLIWKSRVQIFMSSKGLGLHFRKLKGSQARTRKQSSRRLTKSQTYHLPPLMRPRCLNLSLKPFLSEKHKILML